MRAREEWRRGRASRESRRARSPRTVHVKGIKDIIRVLRNDPERTEQLKAILTRSDIQDAEKLEMASALVK